VKRSVHAAVRDGFIADFCRRWGVAELAVFGSMARGDYDEESDVDLLVRYPDGDSRSCDDLQAMTDELGAHFGRKVDLLEERPIANPYRRHNILLDRRVIFPGVEIGIQRIRDTTRFDRDAGLLWDILQAGRKLVDAIRGRTFEEYLQDEFFRLGCERLLITIGQAVRALSANFTGRYPEIPWRKIVNHRNLLVHDYRDIDSSKVWTILTVDVPRLLEVVEPELPR
jgi:uncharacterized protein with HEPN domain/predicted nucleotidyltransferase